LIREIDRKQAQLLISAAVFLGFFSLALTMAPSVRARTWVFSPASQYHWLGYVIWLSLFWFLHHSSKQYLPERDPYLLPILALLTGWGLLTIYRLTPVEASIRTSFGIRQTIWLGLAVIVFAYGLRLPNLNFLRRYKYIWLTGGLLLTALTLIFGTNPMGFGPRLWIGCCGIYIQPSEPLKLLLVIYLAAYFADWSPLLSSKHSDNQKTRRIALASSRIQILIPTFFMTGLALLLLLVQRDLGTASIFIFLYTVMVSLATGWRWVPAASLVMLAGSGLLGYALFDVVRLRIEAWLNPWLDPAGRSYQIVQSLIAIANGGLLGRGPGMGNPGLVPVPHSDFIFTAIAEENGLIGALGLVLILGLLVHRGMRIALHAPDAFRRYLAAGLTAHLIGQSVLIIGGNLRLLPLTGVTLPFISYGGSSLLVSFIELIILLQISSPSSLQTFHQPALRSTQAPIMPLATLLLLALTGTALVTGWWTTLRGPDLLTRTDNPRRAISDRYVRRGSLLDRYNTPLSETWGKPGSYNRYIIYPDLGSVIGYTHPIYGQSGLEASLDPTLRGTQGNDPIAIWWHHLLYGQPPPGLDIRLTVDLPLQTKSDSLLQSQRGALILINAQTGEILVMASHPTFDPNQLDGTWEDLIQDPLTPLLNRATQGSYPLGDLGDLLFAGPEYFNWLAITPQLRLPLAYEPPGSGMVTPLQLVLAAAALSNAGTMPAPRLTLSYQSSDGNWIVLPLLSNTTTLMSPEQADAVAAGLQHHGNAAIWEIVSIPAGEDLTWYLAGNLPGEAKIPLALALVLEEQNLSLAEEIGRTILEAALSP
jgi:cell division protein FtsW (lipid II flippase)